MNKEYESMSDEALAKVAKGGDSFAEEFLIRKYIGKVKAKAHFFYIIGGDREDIVQEGMIGIFKAIHNFDESLDVPFTAFMEMCINKQIYTAIEAAGRLKHSPLNTYVSLNDAGKEHQSTLEMIPASELDQPEAMAVFNDLMEELSKEGNSILSKMEIEVWNLYISGHSYLEIADLLDREPKAVDNALQRIRKKITEHLKC